MLTKKFSLLFVSMVATMALALVPACGDDDGGGTGGGTPDANTGGGTPDAGTGGGAPDAAGGGGGNPVVGLGQLCDQQMPCPTGATCALLSAGATQGMCTVSCGSSVKPAMGNPTPPADGAQMCTTAYTGTVPDQGTPLCALTQDDPNDATMVLWSCGIICGMAQGMDLGGCPPGLSCTQNFCQP